MMNKRENLINLCKQALVASYAIKENEGKHEIIRNIAEFIYNRVNVIDELCSVEKYNIYFNGSAGVGKSTAISNLFSLIDYEKFLKGNKLSDAVLLKNATGRTTICETVIIQTEENESEIRVEPLSKDEFIINVNEYCKFVFLNGPKVDFKLSEELIRVIENMLEIPAEIIDDNEKLNYLNGKFNLNDINEQDEYNEKMMYEIIKHIDYDNRDKTVFKFSEGNFRKWLKDMFEDVNDGKIKKCPLPNKITICINKNDIDLKLPSFINQIIDTRGIDGGERKDIQDKMKEKDSISLMCDEIAKFGGNETVLGIFKQILIKENKDFKFRTFLTGIEKDSELELVNKANDNREMGGRIKIQEAKKKLISNDINFEFSNIMFYNSFYGIEHVSRKILSFDKEKYDAERQELFGFIESRLKNMYSEYTDELLDLLKKINAIEKNSITNETLLKFHKCIDVVCVAKVEMKERTYSFKENFKNEIIRVNASKLRGSVNRMGKYYNFDVYGMSQKLGGEEFKSKCLEIKAHMLGEIDGIFRDCDDIEVICVDCLKSKINSEYSNFYEKNRQYYYEASESFLYNHDTWGKPLQYWGDGYGNYKSRVTDDLVDAIVKNKIETFLEDFKIVEKFYDEIEAFLKF